MLSQLKPLTEIISVVRLAELGLHAVGWRYNNNNNVAPCTVKISELKKAQCTNTHSIMMCVWVCMWG